MIARAWEVVWAALRPAVVSVLAIGAFLVLAAPVEYVKICSLYGAGFYYLPGTDICFNDTLNDARQQTEFGTWKWREPTNPVTWVSKPKDACKGGHVVKAGDITSSDLTELGNSERFETAALSLDLKNKQFIKSVIFQGSFTGPGVGNFCLFFTDSSNVGGNVTVNSFPLGCVNTAPLAGSPFSLAFTPDFPIPPASITDPVLVGANGERWGTFMSSDIQGELKVWLCIK